MNKDYQTGILLTNKELIVISVNPYICHLTGKSEGEIISKSLEEIFCYEKSSLKHSSGHYIPVFFKENDITIDNNESLLYMIWDEKINISNHPLYKTIIEETNDLISIVDPSSKIIFSTISHKTHLNRAPSYYKDHPFLDFVHKDDFNTVATTIKKVLERKQKYQTNFSFQGESNYITVKGSFNPVLNINNAVEYIVIIMRDIDLKNKDMKSVIEREQHFKSLFSHNPDFVFSLDLDFCFKEVNDSMLEATGFTKNEILEMPFSTVITPSFFSKTVLSLLEVKKGIRKNYDTAIIKKQGNPIYVSLSLFPIYVHNQLVGIHGVAKDISSKKEYEKRIYHLAYTDTLTNLPNREKFQSELLKIAEISQKERSNFAIIFFDIDNFKSVNDTLGHNAGDQLLKSVSRRINPILPKNCELFRMGGDEFTIIVKNFNKKTDLTVIAKLVLDSFSNAFLIIENELLISSSIGIASYPLDSKEPNDIVRFADSAMYFSKQKGKNFYSFFEPPMLKEQKDQLNFNMNLKKAIENNEFELYYQPILNAETGNIISAEALIRWNSPEQGLISPALFIPIAEASGMIHPLGKWVIQEACKQLKEWKKKGYKVVPVSINVSGKQFERQGVFRTIHHNLKKYGLEPNSLTIEVTETIAMKTKRNTLATLDRIKKLGCGLAIDDFGSGYSSLSYLKDFPVNKLKLDKSFIENISEDKKMKKIVQIIIDLGHFLNLEVIAEGVETENEYEILKTMGADGIQGYYFSKPLPSKDFESKYFLNNN